MSQKNTFLKLWDILKVNDEECLLAKNQYLIAIWG